MINKKDYVNYTDNREKYNLNSIKKSKFSLVISIITMILSLTMFLIFVIMIYAIINNNYSSKINKECLSDKKVNVTNTKESQKRNITIQKKDIQNITLEKKIDSKNSNYLHELGKNIKDKNKSLNSSSEKTKFSKSDSFSNLVLLKCKYYNNTKQAKITKIKLSLYGIKSEIYLNNGLYLISEPFFDTYYFDNMLEKIIKVDLINCKLEIL